MTSATAEAAMALPRYNASEAAADGAHPRPVRRRGVTATGPVRPWRLIGYS